MKILIAANHYPVASGRYMMDAFRRIGHEVKTAGDSSGNEIWGMTVSDRYVWKPDCAIHEADPAWPDLVVVMDSDTAVWGYVAPRKFQCPVVVFGVDNHVRSYEDELFDHYFLAHYHGPCYPVDPTRKDHTWLPCAADSKLFTPSPIAWEQREYDVACIGVMYPRRAAIVNAMREAGLKVLAETGLLYESYRDAYHNSRISLCVSAAGDVAQRIFETGRMGCAILTDPLLDILDEKTNYALALQGYAVYWSDTEAVSLAQTMLMNQMSHEVAFNTLDALTAQRNATMVKTMGFASSTSMAKACKPHTWEARAQVIVNWFEREYGKAESVEIHPVTTHVMTNGKTVQMPAKTERKPFLNLGCGRVILPGERPEHHQYIPENIYQDEQWVNIDRVGTVGADKVFDLFTYPWPLESNSYDGAILTHIAEHIPHEIKMGHSALNAVNDEAIEDDFYYTPRARELSQLQDGFFAFFSELARVLTPGAEVHLISPHGMCTDAFVDPTHTRNLFPQTFTYFIPNPNAPFEYNVGSQWEIVGQNYGWSEHANRIMNNAMLTPAQREADLGVAMDTQWNIIREFYLRLKVVK